MNTVLLTGIFILIMVAIVFVFLSIKLKAYANKHKSVPADVISNWCSSISSGAIVTLVLGLIIFFLPNFREWNIKIKK